MTERLTFTEVLEQMHKDDRISRAAMKDILGWHEADMKALREEKEQAEAALNSLANERDAWREENVRLSEDCGRWMADAVHTEEQALRDYAKAAAEERAAIVEMLVQCECPTGYAGSSYEAGWFEAISVAMRHIQARGEPESGEAKKP